MLKTLRHNSLRKTFNSFLHDRIRTWKWYIPQIVSTQKLYPSGNGLTGPCSSTRVCDRILQHKGTPLHDTRISAVGIVRPN